MAHRAGPAALYPLRPAVGCFHARYIHSFPGSIVASCRGIIHLILILRHFGVDDAIAGVRLRGEEVLQREAADHRLSHEQRVLLRHGFQLFDVFFRDLGPDLHDALRHVAGIHNEAPRAVI